MIDLFERIESFFKRLEVYKEISLNTKMAEVLVKIVIELLSILSIATKEVGRRRASELPERVLLQFVLHDSCYCRGICQETSWEDRYRRCVEEA